MECDVYKKGKETFNCDGCKTALCKTCGNLTSSEIKVLQLTSRILKFYCPSCRKNETFALLHKIIEAKEQLVQAKENVIESKEDLIDQLKNEIEDLKKKQFPSLARPSKTYANAIGNSPSDITQPPNNVPSIIIKPKNNQDMKKVKEEINNHIKPAELKISVKSIRYTRKGEVIINCPEKNDVEILQKEAIKKLKDNYDIEITRLRKPRIKIIMGSNFDMKKEEIEDCIKEQNKIFTDEDSLNITYIRKKENANTVIYGECNAGLFQKLMYTNKIFIDWQRYPVYEDISITRCFKCQEFFHKKDNCQNKIVCPCCSEEHEFKQCPKTNVRCNNCTIANDKYKLKYNTNHEATNPECPCHKYHLQILKTKINYNPNNG